MESNATWIWYPGDFEVWLGNKFNNRRTERGAMFPPFWKQDSHWPTVVFTKTVELAEAETIAVVAEGHFNLAIDGKLRGTLPLKGAGSKSGQCAAPPLLSRGGVGGGVCNFILPAGKHNLALKVWNQATPPALFIDSLTVKTDSSWLVTYEDKIWIDENGVAHGSGIYVPAASWNFDCPDTPPSAYQLECKELAPVSKEQIKENAFLYDFGKETFGYLKLSDLKGTVHIYYGESREEALDKEHCETLDILHEGDVLGSKAFRYVYIEKMDGADYECVAVDYEYAPFDPTKSGSFRCNDDELNRIWEVSAYTLDLTTREFFCDGIKRDRWTWSGDAIQSYLMNYYLRFDTECVKRTIRQLRGKDPVTAHVNTIMDYTFYWFKSIADYYQYTGDLDFIRELWPKMVTLMDYVLSRTNADGLAEARPDDWIFVDWVDFPMHKRGVLAFEQILFWKALETMLFFANHLAVSYPLNNDYIAALHQKIRKAFWSADRHAYLHAIENGKLNEQITKFPNMFAILYDFADEEEKKQIMDNVLINPDIDAITTPYMRFYELEALCQMGQQAKVLPEIKTYWGGMLREGATTFWEKYNPDETGTEHLAMYGRSYGKSLCHAWGASPLYLLGRYFLGVRPTTPGYEEYEVRPVLGGLDWLDGEVPTPFGKIRVKMNRHEVTVLSDGGKGTLIVGDQTIDIPANKETTLNY